MVTAYHFWGQVSPMGTNSACQNKWVKCHVWLLETHTYHKHRGEKRMRKMCLIIIDLRVGLKYHLISHWLKGQHAVSVESMVTTAGFARKKIWMINNVSFMAFFQFFNLCFIHYRNWSVLFLQVYDDERLFHWQGFYWGGICFSVYNLV